MPLLPEQLVLYIQEYTTTILMALGALNLLVIIWLAVMAARGRRWRRRYHLLMGQTEGKSLEERVVEYRRLTEHVLGQLGEMDARIDSLEQLWPGFMQKVGVVRFKAFPDVGGDLSFAVALLDGQANGVVISSIYGREDSRTFAKPIQGGKSSYRLTQEEEQAIALAANSGGTRAAR